MAKKISISFKETAKDIDLYNILMNMEDKSCEIKQLIRKALDKKDTSKREKEDKNDVNVLDF